MPIDVQELNTRIEQLLKQAEETIQLPAAAEAYAEFRRKYQIWYSQAHHIVSKHLQSRLDDFERHYSRAPDPFVDRSNYGGAKSYLEFTDDQHYRHSFLADFEQQQGILQAVSHAIQLRALEVAALVTADLVHGELDQARELLSNGFTRPAGAVAGVALEAHLKLLHDQSGLTYTDKDTIVPLATNLRKNEVITLGDEKKCIAMSDTRNKCTHKTDEEPTVAEVEELIEDVDRFTKRVQAI